MPLKRIKTFFSSIKKTVKKGTSRFDGSMDHLDDISIPYNETALERTAAFKKKRLYFGLSLLIVFLVIYAMLFICFPPHLIFRDTTTNGGDTGAHNYIAKFFIDELFTDFRMTGWDMGWFAGMPMLTFYFPLPYFFIAILSKIVGYNIAFKLITILGSLILPASIYFFGRMFRFKYPYAEFAAIGAMAFLYMDSFKIYGGNFLGTFAGEFSYSISFGLIFLFLGTLYRGIERNRFDWLFVINCIILLMIVLTHLITLIALLIIVPSLFIINRTWRCARYILAVFVVGFFLSAFWGLPFVLLIDFTPTMNWTNVRDLRDLFPIELIPALVLGATGIFYSVLKKEKKTIPIIWTIVIFMALFFTWSGGRLYNARFLPFIYIFIYLIAAYGALHLYWTFTTVFPFRKSDITAHESRGSESRDAASVEKSGTEKEAKEKEKKSVSWINRPVFKDFRPRFYKFMVFAFVPIIAFLSAGAIWAGDPLGPKWARHNYTGFESRDEWDTYNSLMQYLDTLPYGRVMFEFNKEIIQDYGTPRSFELIPFWTHQAGMEGLLVESSLTAPFHYINQAELSVKPRGTVAGWKVPGRDYQAAMIHLIYMNISYIMASSPEVIADLNSDPRVEFLNEIEPYQFFEIRGEHNYVGIAENNPYRYKPEDWVWDMRDWYLNPQNTDNPVIYDDGSDSLGKFSEISKEELSSVPPDPIAERGEILWENVEREKIEFETTGIGQPHLIKVSYFPNWKADGAEGPYLVSPSFMLVIPTQNVVTLNYGMSTPHKTSLGLTISGWAIIAALLILNLVLFLKSRKT